MGFACQLDTYGSNLGLAVVHCFCEEESFLKSGDARRSFSFHTLQAKIKSVLTFAGGVWRKHVHLCWHI